MTGELSDLSVFSEAFSMSCTLCKVHHPKARLVALELCAGNHERFELYLTELRRETDSIDGTIQLMSVCG